MASSPLGLLKQTGKEILDDNCMSWSAAIAYSTLFSLPPLLVILVAVAGTFFGADTVQEQITEQVGGLIGAEGGEQVEGMIRAAGEFGEGSVVGKVIGALALLIGATGAFGQLQGALNRAWSVRPDPEAGGIKNVIFKRVLSFGLVLTIAFLLLASLVLSALLAAFGDVVEATIGGGWTWVLNLLNFALSLGLVTVLFAAIFKWLPDAEIVWRDVWVGAAVTALLFTIGKTAIGLYLGHSDVGSAFGAAGSVVVILVWIYYTALILLAGAEFTQVWSRTYGTRIEPDERTVRVVESERVVRDEPEAPASEPGADDAASAEASEAEKSEAEKVDRPFVHPREPAPRSGWNE